MSENWRSARFRLYTKPDIPSLIEAGVFSHLMLNISSKDYSSYVNLSSESNMKVFNTRLSMLFVGALGLISSAEASAIPASALDGNSRLINFDNVTGGDCNLCGPSVVGQYAAEGVTFQNPTFQGADTIDANLAPYMLNDSLPNVLFVYQGGLLAQDPAAPFQILFSDPVTKVGFDFGSSTNSFLLVDVFGADNQWLETLTFTGSAAPIGLEGFAGIEESSAITRLYISDRPNSDPRRTLNFAVDNLRFDTSVVPEPSSLVLVCLGSLGMLGFRLRRSLCRRLVACRSEFVSMAASDTERRCTSN